MTTHPPADRPPSNRLDLAPGVGLQPRDLLDLLRDRLQAALAALAVGTRRQYERALKLFATWFVTWAPTTTPPLRAALGELEPATHWWSVIERLLRSGPLVAATVVESFKTVGCVGKAPATVAQRIAALRWAFRLAREGGIVDWDLHVRGPKTRAYRDTRGPGLGAVQKMLAYVDAVGGLVGARDGVLLCLLLILGLRRAEAADLRLVHVDLPGRRLNILGKARSEREWVSLPEILAARIETYLAMRGPRLPDAPLIISFDPAHKATGGLTASGIFFVVRSIAAAAGVQVRVSPHGLRHQAITTALDQSGGDVRRVRMFSRHAKIQTLVDYDDARADLGGEIASGLADAVLGVGAQVPANIGVDDVNAHSRDQFPGSPETGTSGSKEPR